MEALRVTTTVLLSLPKGGAMPRRKQGEAQTFAASRKRAALKDARYKLPAISSVVSRKVSEKTGDELLPCFLVRLRETGNGLKKLHAILVKYGIVRNDENSSAFQQTLALSVDEQRNTYQIPCPPGCARAVKAECDALLGYGVEEVYGAIALGLPRGAGGQGSADDAHRAKMRQRADYRQRGAAANVREVYPLGAAAENEVQ